MNRIIDDEDDIDGGGDNEDDFSERRISNNKKIRLLMKRKKSIVTDRNKLLRKNRTDEFRPIMINQFFLSAMNNDNIMLSELYDKMNISLTIDERKKIIKTDQNDVLSSSLNSNDFVCDSLYIDTTNSSIISSILILLDKDFSFYTDKLWNLYFLYINYSIVRNEELSNERIHLTDNVHSSSYFALY